MPAPAAAATGYGPRHMLTEVTHAPTYGFPRIMTPPPPISPSAPRAQAEKEAKRLRRVLANRESARQTILRRQAIRDELARKVADLSSQNENMKKVRACVRPKRKKIRHFDQ